MKKGRLGVLAIAKLQDIEDKGIKCAKRYLKRLGYANFKTEKKTWDLTATKNGKEDKFEIKTRTMSRSPQSITLSVNQYNLFKKHNLSLIMITMNKGKGKPQLYTWKDIHHPRPSYYRVWFNRPD